VEAFSDEFRDAPMLVTSQEPSDRRFDTWCLPPSIRDHIRDLLRLYLGDSIGASVFTRVQTSGLGAHLRSGYDVRLVIDLLRGDPSSASLPHERLGLYRGVVDAGWPPANDEQRRTQQAQLEAAAWKLVSERDPNDDKRRLKPDVDLPGALLIALADAPDKFGRSVRLVRGVGTDFEFVHDQMNAFLAACWFAREERTIADMTSMLSGSKIWKDTKDAQRTLWNFAAGMLEEVMLTALWDAVKSEEAWDTLRRALERVAEEQGWEPSLQRTCPVVAAASFAV